MSAEKLASQLLSAAHDDADDETPTRPNRRSASVQTFTAEVTIYGDGRVAVTPKGTTA
jgi:hypothetical protein